MAYEYLSLDVDTLTFKDPLSIYADNSNTPTPNPSWTRIKKYAHFRDHLERVRHRFPGARIKTISIGGTLALEPMLQYMHRTGRWPKNLYFHNSAETPQEEIAAVAYAITHAPAGTLRGYGNNYWGTTHQPIQRTELPPPARDHTT